MSHPTSSYTNQTVGSKMISHEEMVGNRQKMVLINEPFLRKRESQLGPKAKLTFAKKYPKGLVFDFEINR